MERLQDGIEKAMNAEGFKAFLETQSKFHNYSPYNAMLIASQMPEATRVAGYKKWQEFGRQVRKGEKGISILAPMMKVFDDDEQGIKVKTVTGFRDVRVFDISQTDGPDLPEPPHPSPLDGNDPIGDELFSRLKDFVTAEGVSVVKGPLYRDGRELNGAWSPSHRSIVINHHLTGDQEVKTFTHEVAHMVADHRDRVGIEDKETVAEASAYVTLAHFGIDSSEYTFNYVTGWAKTPDVFKRNLDEIQKVSNLLITKLGDGCPPAEK
jgi:antirestriction protein ArdC